MTQLDNLVMPYAATLTPQAGVDAMQVLPAHRNWGSAGSSTILAIPDGVSQVSATFNGPHRMSVYHRLSDGSRVLITEVEAGSGMRRSPVVSVPTVSANEGLQMFLAPAANAYDEANYRGSVMVIPIPDPTQSQG